MFNTFNMGIGFMLAVKADKAEEIVKAFADFAAKDNGRCSTMKASIIGKVVVASGKAETQEEQVLFED